MYCHLPMHYQFHNFLALQVKVDTAIQGDFLPSKYCTAPRVFTKVVTKGLSQKFTEIHSTLMAGWFKPHLGLKCLNRNSVLHTSPQLGF